MKKFLPYFTITCLIIALFFICKPFIDEDLSRNNTAHIFMLTCLEQYDSFSPNEFHYAPVISWTDSEKQHYYARLLDEKSNNYYISHPPLAFLCNYAIINAFKLNINDNTLNTINLILLIISGILIFFITKNFTKTNSNFTGIVAMTLYIFNPVNMHAFIFHNFSETWGQFFFVAVLFFLSAYLKKDKSNYLLYLFFAAVFALSYCDWLGICFLLAIFIIYFKKRKEEKIKKVLMGSTISVSLAYGLVFIQYLSIHGFSALKRALGIRFMERSGIFGQQATDGGYNYFNIESWQCLANQIYNILFGVGFIIILLLIIRFTVYRKEQFKSPEIVKISLLSCVFFALAVFSATVTHYIYMARFSPFLSIFAALLANQIINKSKQQNLLKTSIGLIILCLIPLSINKLKQTNIYPDAKQTQLDCLVTELKKSNKTTVPESKGLIESDIIYLTYKSQENLIWERKK